MSFTSTYRSFSIIFFILIWSGGYQLASGQLQYWNTESGLSNDWISQITQDSQGYIWIATQYGLNRFDGYDFVSYHYEVDNPNTFRANWVNALAKDQSGNIWVNSFLGGICLFDPNTGLTTRQEIKNNSVELLNFRTIHCDRNGSIWVGGDDGLVKKAKDNHEFIFITNRRVKQLQEDENGNLFILTPTEILFSPSTNQFDTISTFDHNKVSKIYYDSKNVLWVFGQESLLQINRVNGDWIIESVELNNVVNEAFFYDAPIFEDSKNNLWLGGEQGITIINSDRTETETRSYKSLYPQGSPIGSALSFYEDKHQNIWIGTSKGLLMEAPFDSRFYDRTKFRNVDDIISPREMVQIGNKFWFANHTGLFYVDIRKKNSPIHKVLSESIFALHLSSNHILYAGTLSGLFSVNPHDDSFTLEVSRGSGANQLKGGVVWSIGEDKRGNIWMGCSGALQRFDVQTGKLIHFEVNRTKGLKSSPTQDILIDRQGRLWAASASTGLYLLRYPHEVDKVEKAIFEHFTYEPENQNSLSSNVAIFLNEGNDGSIWVGTDGGLNQLSPDGKKVKRYTRKNGLLDDKVMGLVSDSSGIIWGSSIGHGLFKLNPITEEISFFDRKDGLVSNNFLLSSVFKDEEGIIFFGSDNELQILNPNRVDQVKKTTTTCHFTSLTYAEKKTSETGYSIPLIDKDHISLAFDRHSFLVSFTPVNFYRTEKTTYDFKLDGLHTGWQSNGNQKNFSFTGLAPGDYTLRVKPIHPDLTFNQEEYKIDILISPPWWATWWAYLAYAFLLGLSAFYIYQFQFNRRLEKEESKRLQELDSLKNRLYTNLTHELRTPLTIIMGMANNIIGISKDEIQNKAKMIKRNGQSLLDVVNQILDLSKVESGKLVVHYVHGDFISFLRYIVESFESFARSNDIALHFLPEVEQLFMDFDEEKIQMIVSNLFSNAIKNTTSEGHIYLQARKDKNKLELLIRDTGKGIATEHIPYIFDRFYQTQAKEGSTGVGLSLTKELVHLMNGEIRVESELGRGSTFIMTLPIIITQGVAAVQYGPRKKATAANKFDQLPHANESHDDSVPLILLIEDNDDVLFYLADTLQKNYRLSFAKNGSDGINLAYEQIPDVIISDVMMPMKDGFEVCAELKLNNTTSHIPIIMLTAKADMESRIEGLEHGADAYLPKPFDEKELKVRIKKLLELRHRLQERYQQEEYWETEQLPHETQEDLFVKRVRLVIEEHLEDATFGIKELCTEMSISRVHLHRKLKALTDQSTSHFIRRIRLQKAKKLLIETDLNVSEIAYDVGFSDPAYFSRLFSEVFGQSPSASRKK